MSNQNTKETDDGISNEEEATDIANINNQPPVPSAPRLSDLSSYQSRRSTTNTLELNTDDDNSDMPLPMGMAEEISNTAEPPKQTIGKVEQIDDNNDVPEPPAALLEESLIAAEKSNDMIRSSLESVDDGELMPPTPFHSSNFEQDTIANKIANDDMNQKPAAVDDELVVTDRDSIYELPRDDIERGDVPDNTNTNTGRGDTNRRGWDDIGSSNNNASNDNQIVTEVSTVEEGPGNTVDGGITAVKDDTAIHIPEAFLVEEDRYDDDGEVYIATPTLPWWKQKRIRILIGMVIVLVGALAIALGVSLSSQSNNVGFESTNSTSTVTVFVTPPPTISLAPSLSIAPSSSPPTITYECFGADDGGGYNSILYNAVRAYVSQVCANNKVCPIAQTYGWPMNSWCVGNVKDMSSLFSNMDTFNEDINGWNTSSATDTRWMFSNAEAFNRDLSNFDTSKVTDMSFMFQDARAFNGDVSNFDSSSVTDMESMFYGATAFNGDISNFDTSKVTDMQFMFSRATSFNQDLSNFDTSSVTDMWSMFYEATSFNGDVSNFDTSRVTTMAGMFFGATSFSKDMSNFNTLSVTDMEGMFYSATLFNGDVSNFDTSRVTNMNQMFYEATSFNRDVSNFDTSNVTVMWSMFKGATSFNKDLCSWQDNFPYTANTEYIFFESGCTYKDTPNETQKGPFCASDCKSSQEVSCKYLLLHESMISFSTD